MSNERLIVIGGDAAGMSAASQAKRRRPELEIVVFERSPHTSFWWRHGLALWTGEISFPRSL